MEINIQERKIGLIFTGTGKAEIRLWAPNASDVSVIVSARDLAIPMLKQDFGYWFTSTDAVMEGDEYCFEMTHASPTENSTAQNKPIVRADPASIYQKHGVAGNSTALNLRSFNWTDQNWKGINLEEFIIYELHTGTFTTLGDFSSVEEKLDYLVDLGITAIELMPVSQFPGNRNWGYDGVFPFAVQNTYGGPKALQHLINTCHQKGLAVILDVVYNHMGPEGNYFNDFGPYFTEKYLTPWGTAINFDDANCDPVRQYFIENVLMWFRDFHIDALRLDAVHAIKDFSAIHFLKEVKQLVNQLSKYTSRNYNLIAELDLNDNKYINSFEKGGYGMDAQWVDEFHHSLRVTSGQPKQGYYADFAGIEDLAKSYLDAYVYDGQYSSHREKKFGIKAEGNSGKQFVVFSQNHDQVGNRMLGERTSKLVSFEMLKLLAGSVFCSPYVPLIFMGEEYAEENPFQFFISHADQDLVKAVRNGRKKEFAAFHHEEDVPDPQDEKTFSLSKLNWDRLNEEKHSIMFSFYKKLINLRKSLPALGIPNRNQVKVEVFKTQNCLILKRWENDQKVTCFMNFSAEKQNLPFSNDMDFELKLNSAEKEWGGNHESDLTFNNNHIIIYPESLLIFTSSNV